MELQRRAALTPHQSFSQQTETITKGYDQLKCPKQLTGKPSPNNTSTTQLYTEGSGDTAEEGVQRLKEPEAQERLIQDYVFYMTGKLPL